MTDEAAKPRRRVRHPGLDSTLPYWMGTLLLLSLVIWSSHGTQDGTEWVIFIGICAGIPIGCFFILFTVYWAGWMLRMHTVWLDQRQRDAQS